MEKTKQINVRMEAEAKASAEAVFRQLGLTPTQAITLFYHQVSLQRGLPFTLKIPNAETQAAMRDVLERRDLTEYENADEFRKSLGL